MKNRHPEFPLAAYQVSGEYAMLMKSADAGIIDLKRGHFAFSYDMSHII